MMNANTRAIFPDTWREPLAHGLRVRRSRRFRVLFLVLAVLLGTTSVVHAATASWAANPETDIAGYILSYGTSPGVHPTTVDVKNVTTWQVTTLTPGQTYYFVVQAYNTSAMTSAASAEVVFTDPIVPPSVTSLTPTSGPVGTPVTIAGANFGATQGTSVVTFNGNAAIGSPTSWSATSIVVPVPVGAITGSMSVTVGGLSSNPVSFTVTASTPSISSLSPASGPVGMAVTIAGANLGTNQGTSTVTFNGTAATPTSWSAASFVAPVPSGATTGPVVVTVGGLASNGIIFTLPAPGTIALAQHRSVDGGTTLSGSLAFSSNNVAGNFIAVAIRAGSPSQVFTVKDSIGNSYQKAIQINNGTDDTLAIYYAQNIGAGANTVTVSDAILNTMRFAILEYSGVAASSPLDVTVAGQGSGTTPVSGSVATTAGGDLLLGAIATANSPGFGAAGTGYTIEESVPATGAVLIAEDGLQAVAGSASVTATLLSSDTWVAALAAFRASVVSTLISPANGATNVNMTLPMQWKTILNAQAYYLYVGSTLGTNDFVNTGEIQQTSFLATNVPGGQTVFARVWTKVGGAWRSSDSSFTTAATVPVVATLTSPVNGATNVNMTLPMQWTTLAGAQAYELYLGSTLGAKDLVDTGQIQATSYLAMGLPGGQTVFARLWTEVGGIWRSSDSSFTTLAVATLTFPVNGATNVSMTLPMRWTTVVGAQAYELYLGTILGAKDLVDTGQMQPTSYLATSLPGGQMVFARLWAEAGGVWRSTDSTFTTAPVATLTFPLNGATGVNVPLSMQWTTVAGAQAYELYLGTILGAKDLVDTGQMQPTSYLATSLPGGQTVFARLWAEAGGVWRSTDSTFTTAPVATLTYPLNGATNVNMTLPMQWTTVSGAQAYSLYVGSTQGASNLLYTGEIQQTSYLAIGVPGGQTVFARLWTEVGSVWRFSDSSFTTAPTATVIATLTSPVNGATNVDMTVPMQWTTIVSAQAYYLYVGSTAGTNNLVNTGEIHQASYLAAGLPHSQTVFARLWTEVGGVWRFRDSSFTTAATVPVVATLTSPLNGATNVDMTLPMQWTTVASAQAYELYLGSTLGARDLVVTNEMQQTSYLATSLPKGQTVFARLWTEVGGVWRFSDSSFTTAP